MLAEAEYAWGKLLAATVGLSDEDYKASPPEGGWSIRQVLEHVIASERAYMEAIRTARLRAREADADLGEASAGR